MKKMYCVIFAFLIWGCHNKPASSSATNATAQAPNTVMPAHTTHLKPLPLGMTDTVVCQANPAQKYAVYLPQSYTQAKKWPIIYFFDPHGAGNFPLELYKKLADKYGYILTGTYGSQNGMQWSDIDKAIQAFMQDSWQRFSIDNNRMYTFGFSGGARVACSVAIYDGGIAGVAACGGGFPERNPVIRQPFTFIGFAGNLDFNCIEMQQLDRELDGTQLPHQLIVYKGKHQWPPEEVAEQAFQWFDLNAMKMHLIPANDSIVNSVKNTLAKEADKYIKQKNKVQEYYACKKLANYIGNLSDIRKYAAIMQNLQKSDTIQQYLNDMQSTDQDEMQVEGEFINELSNKDIDWWQGTVKQLRDYIKKDPDSPAAIRNQRLLNYLSLATYMGTIQAFRSNNDAATAHFLQLYKLVDPANPEHSYLFGCVYARENNAAKALSSLQDAVKLGFDDTRRMQQDSNFSAIKNIPAFKALIKKMKDMPHKVDMTE